jgi:hypothetical protein
VASEAELTASAVAHAKKTTKSWAWYLNKIANDGTYQYENTEWYKAGADLEAIKAIPPTPPPQPAKVLAQNLLFVTSSPDSALRVDHKFKLLVSADPAYRQWENQNWLTAAKNAGFWLGTWCDCRTTLPDVAKELASRYKMNGWCGQAELESELDIALSWNAPLIVGNANAWNSEWKALVTNKITLGETSFTQEAYTNATGTWPDQTSAGGVPCASLCIALYDAASENPGVGRYVSVDEYKLHTPPSMWSAISCYDGGARPGELEKL